jgi:hypothetical protein
LEVVVILRFLLEVGRFWPGLLEVVRRLLEAVM